MALDRAAGGSLAPKNSQELEDRFFPENEAGVCNEVEETTESCLVPFPAPFLKADRMTAFHPRTSMSFSSNLKFGVFTIFLIIVVQGDLNNGDSFSILISIKKIKKENPGLSQGPQEKPGLSHGGVSPH